MTPGTQPQRVSKKTITKEPQPFPNTAKGGKNIANKTLNKLILFFLGYVNLTKFVLKCYKKIAKRLFQIALLFYTNLYDSPWIKNHP